MLTLFHLDAATQIWLHQRDRHLDGGTIQPHVLHIEQGGSPGTTMCWESSLQCR